MNISRRIFIGFSAVALTLAGTAGANAAPMNVAPGIAQMSSSAAQVALPVPAYDLVDKYNVDLPDFIWQSSPQLERDLRAATASHLRKQGHVEDSQAAQYAREWAGQAAHGKVTFYGKSGNGNTHLDVGSGNIYRFNRAQAKQHVAWLSRDIPVSQYPGAKKFGVATSTDGRYVYVVEYFLD